MTERKPDDYCYRCGTQRAGMSKAQYAAWLIMQEEMGERGDHLAVGIQNAIARNK